MDGLWTRNGWINVLCRHDQKVPTKEGKVSLCPSHHIFIWVIIRYYSSRVVYREFCNKKKVRHSMISLECMLASYQAAKKGNGQYASAKQRIQGEKIDRTLIIIEDSYQRGLGIIELA